MGTCLSSDPVNDQVAKPVAEEAPLVTEGIGKYRLKKSRAGCSGMFWRSDPTGRSQLLANSNWPRDGAIIEGQPIVVGGDKWLQAFKVQQMNSKDWLEAPDGAFLPFEYDNHYYLEPAE